MQFSMNDRRWGPRALAAIACLRQSRCASATQTWTASCRSGPRTPWACCCVRHAIAFADRIGLFSGARLGCIVLLPLGGGASSVAGGAFWASTEPAAAIITHARIIRLMNILLVGPDKPSFPSEEVYSSSHNALALRSDASNQDLPRCRGFPGDPPPAFAASDLFWNNGARSILSDLSAHGMDRLL